MNSIMTDLSEFHGLLAACCVAKALSLNMDNSINFLFAMNNFSIASCFSILYHYLDISLANHLFCLSEKTILIMFL
jgi:hypothetical protein